jgi:hypothetical protein
MFAGQCNLHIDSQQIVATASHASAINPVSYRSQVADLWVSGTCLSIMRLEAFRFIFYGHVGRQPAPVLGLQPEGDVSSQPGCNISQAGNDKYRVEEMMTMQGTDTRLPGHPIEVLENVVCVILVLYRLEFDPFKRYRRQRSLTNSSRPNIDFQSNVTIREGWDSGGLGPLSYMKQRGADLYMQYAIDGRLCWLVQRVTYCLLGSRRP